MPSRDAQGRPECTEEIACQVRPDRRHGFAVTPPTPTGRIFAYACAGEEDRLGAPVLEPLAD